MKTQKLRITRRTRVIKTVLTAATAVAVTFGSMPWGSVGSGGGSVARRGFLSLTASAANGASAEQLRGLIATAEALLDPDEGSVTTYNDIADFGEPPVPPIPGTDYGKYPLSKKNDLTNAISVAKNAIDAEEGIDNAYDNLDTAVKGFKPYLGEAPNKAELAELIAEATSAKTNLPAYPNEGSLPPDTGYESFLNDAINEATEVFDTKTADENDVTNAIDALSRSISNFEKALVRNVGDTAKAGNSAGAATIFSDLTGGGFKMVGIFDRDINVIFNPLPSDVSMTDFDNIVQQDVGDKIDDIGYEKYAFDITVKESGGGVPTPYSIPGRYSAPIKLNKARTDVKITLSIPESLKDFKYYTVFHLDGYVNDDKDEGVKFSDDKVKKVVQYSKPVRKLMPSPSPSPKLTWVSLDTKNSGDSSVTFTTDSFSPFVIVGYGTPDSPTPTPTPAQVSGNSGGSSGGGQAVYITSDTTAPNPGEPTTATATDTAAEPTSAGEFTTDEPITLDTPSYTQSEPPTAEPPSVSDNGNSGNPGGYNTAVAAHGRSKPVAYPIDTGAAIVPVGIVALACVVTSATAMLLKRRRK